jgi:hypothetical protein
MRLSLGGALLPLILLFLLESLLVLCFLFIIGELHLIVANLLVVKVTGV